MIIAHQAEPVSFGDRHEACERRFVGTSPASKTAALWNMVNTQPECTEAERSGGGQGGGVGGVGGVGGGAAAGGAVLEGEGVTEAAVAVVRAAVEACNASDKTVMRGAWLLQRLGSGGA